MFFFFLLFSLLFFRYARNQLQLSWQKYAATLVDNKIDHESCVSSMRLLSLCSLATEHEEIPYQVHQYKHQQGWDES